MKSHRSKAKAVFYRSDDEVRAALLHIFIYICFLVVTTTVALAVRDVYMFYFNKTIEKLFLRRGIFVESDPEYDLLITTRDWWEFLENEFLTHLHGIDAADALNDTLNDDKLNRGKYTSTKELHHAHKGRIRRSPKSATSRMDSRKLLNENHLLGPARFRQIRVLNDSCKVHEAFDRYFNSCYAEYSPKWEDSTPNFKGTKFYTRSELGSRPIWGRVDTYYGAGYVKDLTYNYEENVRIISELKEKLWVDRATRIMIVEFGLYNMNTALFDNVKFIAEMPPIGGVLTSAQIQSLKLHSFWTGGRYGIMIAACLFYLFIIYYSVEECTELVRFGILQYFKHIWNYVDFIISVLGYLSLAYSIFHTIYLKRLLERVKTEPNKYQNLDVICFWNMLFVDMMAICAFCVWIKLFKYISFNKTLMQFSVTIKRCSKDLFGFGMMFMIVFAAYAMLGLLLFGDYHVDFRNFQCSFLTLMRMVLGDFDYIELERANRVLGPIYFLSYILLVFFILLNMFLAIINDTYTTVKSEIKHGRNHLEQFIVNSCRRLCQWFSAKCSRRQRAPQAQAELLKNPSDVHVKPSASTVPQTSATTIQDAAQPHPTASGPLRMRESELINEYFEEVTPGAGADEEQLRRLTNRIALVEDLLEELVGSMDHILKRIDGKKRAKQD